MTCPEQLTLFDKQNALCQELNEINAYRLYWMLEKCPTLRNSWNAFVIDYKLCSSIIIEE
jgi:hypothetical protein